MQILDWNTLDPPARRAALARPSLGSRADIAARAADIVARVRAEGDTALLALTRELDGVALESLQVGRGELRAARATLEDAQLAALETAYANVRAFHEASAPQPLALEVMPGVHCERIVRPIASVGLYVPAGSAPLPSAVIMLGVPAQIAGCRERVLCTPPRRDGTAHPAVLAAAGLCGIDVVFKIGGAQAIAALAYGTDSVPKVHKIFGPGNAWVTAAKQLVASDPDGAACDLPAGPSEVLVIADDSARPAFVAADLLAQAEHDVLAQAILVTTSPTLARAVANDVAAQMRMRTRAGILERSMAASRCIVVPDLAAALDVSNDYAPEHLILHLRDPRRWLEDVQHAGSIFLGAWTPEPLGDYCSGTNHVLPTYGHARAYSGLSTLDFVKRMTVQELTPAGLRVLGPVAATLATLEGLDAHAAAVHLRLAQLDGGGV